MNSCFHVVLRCPIRPYYAVSPGHAPISRRIFSPVMPSGKLLYSSFSAEHNRYPRSPSPKCVHCPSGGVWPFVPTHTCLGLLARFGNMRNHSMSIFYMIPCERLLHIVFRAASFRWMILAVHALRPICAMCWRKCVPLDQHGWLATLLLQSAHRFLNVLSQASLLYLVFARGAVAIHFLG